MVSIIKTKLYAVGALIAIAIGAYMKWLHASNKEKARKIVDLKREAKIAKKVSQMEADTVEYRGFQEAININAKQASATTRETKLKRGAIDEEVNPDYTVVDL